MKKRITAILALAALAVGYAAAAENILGLWKSMSDKTGKPTSIAMIYSHQGKVYGRILALYNKETSLIDDTTAIRKYKADAIVGDPATCGLDIIYEMQDKGKEWGGLIMDPEAGKEYDCRIWKDGDKLIIRGQLKGLIKLGRNQTWLSVTPAELPAGYQLPDPNGFKPAIPKGK